MSTVLDDAFNIVHLWKAAHKITWCELCNSYSISCNEKNCHGSSCNAGGCDKCGDVFNDFHKAKTSPWAYLSEAELIVLQKERFLKDYILDSLEHGEYEINWKRLKENGQLCKLSEDLFKTEIETAYAKKEA